jgi:hypothetical protein
MKKLIWVGLGTLLIVMLGMGVLYAQSPSLGTMDQGRGSGFGQRYDSMNQGGQYSPYDGARQQGDWNGDPAMRGRDWNTDRGIMDRFLDMFSGMMERNRDMGSGMMGRGRGMGSGMMGHGWGSGSGCR